MACACRTHSCGFYIFGCSFDLFAVRAWDVRYIPALDLLTYFDHLITSWARENFAPRDIPGAVLSAPSSVVPAAMHLMYYTNEEGHRVYTLKVPPSPRRRIVLRCSARGAAHAKRDQASAPLYAHICLLRRKRLRTAGRRNPRTLPASRPMTNSPSSASSARSASACCRCSARRWPCELLPTRAPLRCMSYWRPL